MQPRPANRRRKYHSSLAAAVCGRVLAHFAHLLNGLTMLFLISIIAAILAWLLGRPRFAQMGILALKIRYANVGTVYQQPSLLSARYGLSGRLDYLVRVDDGLVAVELKSGRSPRSGRPYKDHMLQLAAYCLLVEDVCQTFVPYGLLQYEDRFIWVEYTSSVRRELLVLLEEMTNGKTWRELHVNHNCPAKRRSCGFREVCGEVYFEQR
jgi:CRISPR-associated exonuclease Cas4